MKTLSTVGVVAFFMLSACAVSNREGYEVVRHPRPETYVTVPSAEGKHTQQYSSKQVHFVAYGQVLSYWASQLK